MSTGLYGCFYNLGVLLVGVLIAGALLFWVFTAAPDFWNLPYLGSVNVNTASWGNGMSVYIYICIYMVMANNIHHGSYGEL